MVKPKLAPPVLGPIACPKHLNDLERPFPGAPGERDGLDLLVTTDRLNRSLAERILHELRARVSREVTVAILGLAYKPSSHVIEESQAMMMAKAFLERGARVLAYDPLAGEAANLELGGRALIMDNARDCLRDADLVLIATPDPEFKTITVADFRRGGRPVLVMDFWRILSDQLSGAEGIEYVPYGRGAATLPSDVFTQLWGATPTRYGR